LLCHQAGIALAQDGVRREEGEKVEPAKAPVLTAPPQLLEAAAPEYPQAAAAQGLEAQVKVRIRIEADGSVSQAEVVEAVGNGFDEAAVAAARQYRFKPAEWDGVPGPIVVETVIHFVLQEEPEPAPPPAAPAGPGTQPAKAEQGPPEHGGNFDAPVSIGVDQRRGPRARHPTRSGRRHRVRGRAGDRCGHRREGALLLPRPARRPIHDPGGG
jgi:TonB family protein